MDAMTNQPHEEALKALQGAYPYAMIVGEIGDKKLEPDAKKLNEGGFGAPACIIFKHSPHLVKYFHAEEGKSYPPAAVISLGFMRQGAVVTEVEHAVLSEVWYQVTYDEKSKAYFDKAKQYFSLTEGACQRKILMARDLVYVAYCQGWTRAHVVRADEEVMQFIYYFAKHYQLYFSADGVEDDRLDKYGKIYEELSGFIRMLINACEPYEGGVMAQSIKCPDLAQFETAASAEQDMDADVGTIKKRQAVARKKEDSKKRKQPLKIVKKAADKAPASAKKPSAKKKK